MKEVISKETSPNEPKVKMTPLAQFLQELVCNVCGSTSEYREPKIQHPRGKHPHYCTNNECIHLQMESEKYPSIVTRKITMPEKSTEKNETLT